MKICFLFLAFLSCLSVAAQPGVNNKKLDSLFDALSRENRAMGQVAIAQKGIVTYARAFGYQEIMASQKKPADTNTRYRIGSISKMFTATAILQLVEEGKITLDTRLSQFFPTIAQSEAITIRQLLQHQSGLHNFTDDSAYQSYYTLPKTRKQLLTIFEQLKPDFSPGADLAYSNTAYVLLSFIIEDITGKAYGAAIDERIIRRLSLQNTYVADRGRKDARAAHSYLKTGDQWSAASVTDPSVPMGAGNIVSTAKDLNQFIAALFHGRLLSQASLDAMQTLKGRYGLGILRFPFYDAWAWGHTGGIDGFNAMLTYLPEADVAVCYLGNGLDFNLNEIMICLLSEGTGRPWTMPQTQITSISAEKLNPLVGAYHSDALPLKINLTVNNGVLYGQATGQGAFPLAPVNDSTFQFAGAGIKMVFKKSGDDKQQFTLYQGGNEYLFQKD